MSTPVQTRSALTLVEEALALILADAQPVSGAEHLPLAECRHRILASEVHSEIDVPPADNSSMDGYAFCFADYAAGQRQFRLAPLPASGVGLMREEFLLAGHGGKSSLGYHSGTRPTFCFFQFG